MQRNFLALLLPAALLAGVLSVGAPARAQQAAAAAAKPGDDEPPTVLEGIFTDAQAKRGKQAYDENCASCHRADLTGFSAPPLKGDLFMDRWREFKLDVLYTLIKNTMPNGAPGTLAEPQYLDIVSYILQTNELPAGKTELSTDLTKSRLLVGKDGPQPLPNSSLADAVGCLVLETGQGWFLTHASEPIRTLNQWEFSPEDTKLNRDKDFGDQLFRLNNITDVPGFDPQKAGEAPIKSEAKGTLVRQDNGAARINVTAVQVVGGECQP
jgi:mono/diheme cytochrome c family protein